VLRRNKAIPGKVETGFPSGIAKSKKPAPVTDAVPPQRQGETLISAKGVWKPDSIYEMFAAVDGPNQYLVAAWEADTQLIRMGAEGVILKAAIRKRSGQYLTMRR
jgi:hypothetical protein